MDRCWYYNCSKTPFNALLKKMENLNLGMRSNPNSDQYGNNYNQDQPNRNKTNLFYTLHNTTGNIKQAKRH